MNPRRQKLIDRLAGVPAVCCAAAIVRLVRLFKSLLPAESPAVAGRRDSRNQRIVILKFFGLGSLVQLMPAIQYLRRIGGEQAHLTLITSATVRESAEVLGIFERVESLDIDSLPNLIRDTFRVVMRSWRREIDLLVDAEFLANYTALLGTLLSARRKVGFRAGPCRNSLYDRVVDLREENYHIRDDFLNLVLEGNDHEVVTAMPLLPDSLAMISARYRQPGIRLVGLNINTSLISPERLWPQTHFATLLKDLDHNPEIRFALIGLASEKERVRDFLNLLDFHLRDRCIDYTGRTTVRDLVSLMKSLDCLISIDSGPLALAVILDVPTISFWGPETPRRYGPRSTVISPESGLTSERHLVLTLELPCSPCLKAATYKTPPCRGANKCMREMTSDWVLEKIQRQPFFRELFELP
jgi:ADP-heptose:LPS heptosyltransferase